MVYKYFAQFENSSWEHQAKPSKLPLHRTWVEQTELKERGPEETSSLSAPPCLTFP